MISRLFLTELCLNPIEINSALLGSGLAMCQLKMSCPILMTNSIGILGSTEGRLVLAVEETKRQIELAEGVLTYQQVLQEEPWCHIKEEAMVIMDMDMGAMEENILVEETMDQTKEINSTIMEPLAAEATKGKEKIAVIGTMMSKDPIKLIPEEAMDHMEDVSMVVAIKVTTETMEEAMAMADITVDVDTRITTISLMGLMVMIMMHIIRKIWLVGC
jgi:hypothetical protein